jgi:DNA-binding NarL/FixJ family response regulator
VSEPISVVIVDDHQMFREGIRSRINGESDMTVVGEAGTAEAAFDLVEETDPTVLILDIRLPNMSGLEAARLLRNRHPDLSILLLTGYDFEQYVRAAARARIQGYLLKDSPQEKLIDAVREIARGGTVLSPDVASKVIKDLAEVSEGGRPRRTTDLTVREIEILEMLYQGLRNAAIGDRLKISTRTVEAHVGNVISKLGAQNRTEAVQIALRDRIIR